MFKKPEKHLWLPYMVCPLLILLAYHPILSGGFILDDRPLIENNRYLRQGHSLSSYLSQEDSIIDGKNEAPYHTGYYRPLVNLTYRLDFMIWGLNACGFRLTNILFHMATSILLFYILRQLFSETLPAFWGSALFALHPVNTEAISFIVSRNNILVTFFSIACIYLYLRGREEASWTKYTLSLIFFATALASKEFAFMIPPLLFVFNRLLDVTKKDYKLEFIGYVPFIIILASYLLLKKGITGTWTTAAETGNIIERIYFAPYLIIYNLKLLFLPHDLHSFIVRYPCDYSDWRGLAGIAGMIMIIYAVWTKRRDRFICLPLICFIIAIFPVLNLIKTSAVTLISMRWLYFPLPFIMLIAGKLKAPLMSRSFLVNSMLLIITFYFGSYSYILNKNLWKDENSFFSQEVIVFDNHFYSGGLGINLLEKKKYREAEKYLKVALEKYPGGEVLLNYAVLLIETGRYESALPYLEKASLKYLTSDQKGLVLNNFGTVFFKTKNYDRALRYFEKAVYLCPDRSDFWANLGSSHGAKGQYQAAIEVLNRGLELSGESSLLRKNLAMAYIRLGDFSNAMGHMDMIPSSEWKRLHIDLMIKGINKRISDQDR